MKKCPILLAAWLSHYGTRGDKGQWLCEEHTTCESDCAWYNKKYEGCELLNTMDDIRLAIEAHLK